MIICLLIACSIFASLFPSIAHAETRTSTFYSEAAIDGYIAKWGRPYPPTQYTDIDAGYDNLIIGQWKDRDTTQPGYIYCMERGYVSFDTSSIPDTAIITSVKLRLETQWDQSVTDFTMEIRGGAQPIISSSLDATDWGKGTTILATWNTANYPGSGQYITFSLSTGQVNRAGRTQFELKSNRDSSISPPGNEYISFYSGETTGKPYLEVTWYRRGFAVLIVGGGDATANYARYWNDLMFMYDALTTRYQFTAANVYVLYANGAPPSATNCPDPTNAVTHANVIDFAATAANLQTVFTTLSTTVTNDDFLLVHSNDHGSTTTGHSWLVLWGQAMRDDLFASTTYLGRVTNYYREAIVMKQCYSGGFIDDLTSTRRVVMTSCTATQESWACDTEGNYGEFTYHWISAVFGHTPTGTTVNADTNGDGLISMTEAYTYAQSHDSRNTPPTQETPQFNDPGNLGPSTFL
jgi:hypothetical protein